MLAETGQALQVLRAAFPDHALLGEEGGISGETSSDYLWCIDPLDVGTLTNLPVLLERVGQACLDYTEEQQLVGVLSALVCI